MPGAHFCGSDDHGFGDNHDLRPGPSLAHEDEAADLKGLGEPIPLHKKIGYILGGYSRSCSSSLLIPASSRI
jgi:hypothetical protein